MQKVTDEIAILCNDVVYIGTVPSKLLNDSVVVAFSLIGVGLEKNVLIMCESLPSEGEFRFAIIPQNTNFMPSESNGIGYFMILLC